MKLQTHNPLLVDSLVTPAQAKRVAVYESGVYQNSGIHKMKALGSSKAPLGLAHERASEASLSAVLIKLPQLTISRSSCRFLKLPNEIRNIVYAILYLFPKDIPIRWSSMCFGNNPHSSIYGYIDTQSIDRPTFATSFLQTCHQINNEARNVLYGRNTLVLISPKHPYRCGQHMYNTQHKSGFSELLLLEAMRPSTLMKINHFKLVLRTRITEQCVDHLLRVLKDMKNARLTLDIPELFVYSAEESTQEFDLRILGSKLGFKDRDMVGPWKKSPAY